MAVVLEIIDLLVCRKIHGCGCFADDPAPRKSNNIALAIVAVSTIHHPTSSVSGHFFYIPDN
jgi:hypothetical protein